MYATTDTVPPPQSAPKGFLARGGDPAGMRARIAVNIFRVVLGVAILASLPLTGPLALTGTIPIVWGAVSFSWIYRERHSVQGKSTSSAAR